MVQSEKILIWKNSDQNMMLLKNEVMKNKFSQLMKELSTIKNK